jgi:hypothetical protein
MFLMPLETLLTLKVEPRAMPLLACSLNIVSRLYIFLLYIGRL